MFFFLSIAKSIIENASKARHDRSIRYYTKYRMRSMWMLTNEQNKYEIWRWTFMVKLLINGIIVDKYEFLFSVQRPHHLSIKWLSNQLDSHRLNIFVFIICACCLLCSSHSLATTRLRSNNSTGFGSAVPKVYGISINHQSAHKLIQ